MDNGESHDNYPEWVLPVLAEAYEAMLKLADNSIQNVPACMVILQSLSEFDIQTGETRRAKSPYVELNEYFLYLLDLQQVSDQQRRKYCEANLRKFRGQVEDFIKSQRLSRHLR